MNFRGNILQIGLSHFRHLLNVYAKEFCMAKFGIGETHYDGEKRIKMAIQCLDEPNGPLLYEGEVTRVSAVVRKLN